MDKTRLTLIDMEVLKIIAGYTYWATKEEQLKPELEVEPDGEKSSRC
jgi:hypothetical protein